MNHPKPRALTLSLEKRARLLNQLTIGTGLLLVLFLLSACSTKPVDNRRFSQVEKELRDAISSIERRANRDTGILSIRRYGEGFDIFLQLDANHENVDFKIELPVEPQDDIFASDTKDDGEMPSAVEEAKEQAKSLDSPVAKYQASSKLVLAAQRAFYEKNYTHALDSVDAAITLYPENAMAHALRGSIYYKLNDRASAKASWQQALALDPSMTKVQESLNGLK